jgi:hypothetical protein
MCLQSCSLAMAVVVSPLYKAVTWQWLYMSQSDDSGPTLQLELIDLHCRNEFWSKFKEGFFLCHAYKCVPKDNYWNL